MHNEVNIHDHVFKASVYVLNYDGNFTSKQALLNFYHFLRWCQYSQHNDRRPYALRIFEIIYNFEQKFRD